MKLIWSQCRAEIVRLLRNPYYVFSSLLMPIMFYIIFTKLVNTGVPDQEAWQAHYLMSMTTFSVMGSAILTLGIRNVQERSQGWATFMKVTPLPDHLYFFAKMVGQSVIHILSVIVIFTVGALVNNVSLPLMTWLTAGSWIVIASFAFMALGTLLGTMKKVDTAVGVGNVIFLGMAITGGMWMPLESFPSLMQSIGKWLPSHSFTDSAWAIVSGERPELRHIILLLGYTVVFILLSSYIRRKQEAGT
ncbi:ABC transporter permease [Salipaludibacillus sp. LMS25]|uniref:ABC transporter permease n=1 Tax=Salipaludibacillus sp. LMS25 TaxID=2924031 RepID=UPI0020D0B148|nr:ABC transporter permease [Salipaludibacillus sp. LMS25]UTR13746.1 ABC transporter permease [Salipaludibacillus sp. LMS25]